MYGPQSTSNRRGDQAAILAAQRAAAGEADRQAASAASRRVNQCRLKDGSVLNVVPLPEVDEHVWAHIKKAIEDADPGSAMVKCARNPNSLRVHLQRVAIEQFYESKITTGGDQEIKEQLASLETDEGLRHVMDEIRQHGLETLFTVWDDEDLMTKIAEKWGFMAPDFLEQLKVSDDPPLSFHEAAQLGKTEIVSSWITRQFAVDEQDNKGITPLGYACGQGHCRTVELLIKCKACPHAVDAGGNNALHYAAGYGKRDCIEVLSKGGINWNAKNKHGQTPLTVATMNRHQECVDMLLMQGGTS